MRQRLLVFRAVIAIDCGFQAGEFCHDIAGAFFAFELNKASAPGEEFAASLGNSRASQFGIFAIGFFIGDGNMCNPKCGHWGSFR